MKKKIVARALFIIALIVLVLLYSVYENMHEKKAPIKDSIVGLTAQTVTSVLDKEYLPNIKVKRGVPLKWTIIASKENLNECNKRIIIRQFGKSAELRQGKNVVQFTPDEDGTFFYSCWMGMERGSITVIEKKESNDL